MRNELAGGKRAAAGEVDLRVGYVLKQAQHVLRTAMEEALREQAVTAPQYAVLSALETAPGLSGAELARRSFVTAQTMQEILTNLEAAGRIERRRAAGHGRILAATLTERGGALLRVCHASVTAVEERMLRQLTAEERGELVRLLRCCMAGLTGD
jgi:DNA-binding MarR family transcriptional regulator